MEFSSGRKKESRILVMGDFDISDLLAIILKSEGLGVYHASNGRDGFKSAYEIYPDLIILDIVMPPIDGGKYVLA
jgi:DNA-binding response OmpR family regulator